MLRSGHIPYNIFTPMEEDLDAANMLFNGIIIRGGISKISRILMSMYLLMALLEVLE